MAIKTIITSIIMLVGIGAGVIGIASKMQEQSRAPNEMPAQGRLKWHAQRAKAKGQQEVVLSAPIVEYDGSASSISIDKMLFAYTVVVAQPIEARSYSVESNNIIITWYKFKVLETLSQQSAPTCPGCPAPELPQEMLPLEPDEFLVSKAGGALLIDGVKVTMAEGGFPPFKLKQKYLLFVSKRDSGFAEIGGGPIGAFTVRDDEAIAPVNSQNHPLKDRILNNLGLSLGEVKQNLRTRAASRRP